MNELPQVSSWPSLPVRSILASRAVSLEDGQLLGAPASCPLVGDLALLFLKDAQLVAISSGLPIGGQQSDMSHASFSCG